MKAYLQVSAAVLVCLITLMKGSSVEWKTLSEYESSATNKKEPYSDLIRSFRPTNSTMGPRRLGELPLEVRKRFLEHNMGSKIGGGRFLRYGITVGQVHERARPFMKYSGFQKGWSNRWSAELVETLVRAVRAGKDISCPDYPESAQQIQTALDTLAPLLLKGNKLNKPLKVLIAGSISPWLEAIVLAHPQFSATSNNLLDNHVVTTDYNPLEIEHPAIHFVPMEDLKRGGTSPDFDLILSYSSIEHDGLGRYGDPINPRGDIAAMAEYHTMLRPEGYLMLAVPTVPADDMAGTVKSNNARVFSLQRLQKCWCGFDTLGERIDPPSFRPDPTTGKRPPLEKDISQYQPIFLLQKKKKQKHYNTTTTTTTTTTMQSPTDCYKEMLP